MKDFDFGQILRMIPSDHQAKLVELIIKRAEESNPEAGAAPDKFFEDHPVPIQEDLRDSYLAALKAHIDQAFGVGLVVGLGGLGRFPKGSVRPGRKEVKELLAR